MVLSIMIGIFFGVICVIAFPIVFFLLDYFFINQYHNILHYKSFFIPKGLIFARLF